MKSYLLPILILLVICSCHNQSDINEINDDDPSPAVATEIDETWEDAASWLNGYAKDSSLVIEKIPIPLYHAELFKHTPFATPDSVLAMVRYARINEQIVKTYGTEVLFLNVGFPWAEEDYRERPIFQGIENRETLKSFQKEYDCCYQYIYGYADYRKNEIYFVWGEGAWQNRLRYIDIGDGSHIVIHSEGNRSITTKVYHNRKQIDSTYSQVEPQ